MLVKRRYIFAASLCFWCLMVDTNVSLCNWTLTNKRNWSFEWIKYRYFHSTKSRWNYRVLFGPGVHEKPFCKKWHIYWLCAKSRPVPRAGTSNYTPQYLWDVNSCPCPRRTSQQISLDPNKRRHHYSLFQTGARIFIKTPSTKLGHVFSALL